MELAMRVCLLLLALIINEYARRRPRGATILLLEASSFQYLSVKIEGKGKDKQAVGKYRQLPITLAHKVGKLHRLQFVPFLLPLAASNSKRVLRNQVSSRTAA